MLTIMFDEDDGAAMFTRCDIHSTAAAARCALHAAQRAMLCSDTTRPTRHNTRFTTDNGT